MIGCGYTKPFPLTPKQNHFSMGDEERQEMFRDWNKQKNKIEDVVKDTLGEKIIIKE